MVRRQGCHEEVQSAVDGDLAVLQVYQEAEEACFLAVTANQNQAVVVALAVLQVFLHQ
jgi:hypothetical protein